MAEVQVIPPKAARPDTLRVAAYCRVSSDSADQLHSYAAQIRARGWISGRTSTA